MRAQLMTTPPQLALALAARSGVAAVLAWSIVAPFGGLADEYAYYAPFGAVVVVSTTVLGSLRTTIGVVLALAIGGVLGLTVQALELPGPVGVGVAVGIGTLLAPLRWLGAMGSWAPIAALFVLILGATNPEQFLTAYLGLTTLGAVVGTGVNLAFPPLHVVATERAQESLRETLVDQLQALARELDESSMPDSRRLLETPLDLRRHSHDVEDLVGQALGGPPVNWRLARWHDRASSLQAHGRALAALALVVGGLADILGRQAAAAEPRPPWRSQLGAPTASAMRATAEALRAVNSPELAQRVVEARDEVDQLARAIATSQDAGSDDQFAAGSLVLGLRRILDAIEVDQG